MGKLWGSGGGWVETLLRGRVGQPVEGWSGGGGWVVGVGVGDGVGVGEMGWGRG